MYHVFIISADKFGRQCARAVHAHKNDKEGSSRHIWTQVPGCSESFLRKLFKTLLGGTCKSLTGLCEASQYVEQLLPLYDEEGYNIAA